MVIDKDARAAKFKAKYDADVVRSRFAATKEDAGTKFTSNIVNYVTRETDVNTILNALGVMAPLRPSYLNVGRESLGIKTRYAGYNLTSDAEATLIGRKWIGRGLSTSVINSIIALDGFTAIA